MANVVDILKERGLFENMTHPALYDRLQQPLTLYAGFDPTSDSLQIGNFVTLMALAHFQRAGHRVIAVAGGATGMIGDPSGKSTERNLLSAQQVEHNLQGIKENLSRFLDFQHPTAPAKILNNQDWLGSFTFIDFLREVGRHFRMGTLLGKDSVRSRLNSETGMSFAEFSYPLLQGYDFLNLLDRENCILQIGGSDQWGNITAGIDLIHKLRGVETYGLTFPLVCDSSGRKFGKSEGNAVYLDARKTSCYDFYQFFVRTEDADVIRLLKIMTFLSLDEIAGLEQEHLKAPEQRIAQRKLAEAVTLIVHGPQGLQDAQRASAVLFGESMEGLHAAELLGVFAQAPSSTLSPENVRNALITDLCVAAGLCPSKSDARRRIENGGIYINNRRIADVTARISAGDVIEDQLVVLRSGKKNFHLVRIG